MTPKKSSPKHRHELVWLETFVCFTQIPPLSPFISCFSIYPIDIQANTSWGLVFGFWGIQSWHLLKGLVDVYRNFLHIGRHSTRSPGRIGSGKGYIGPQNRQFWGVRILRVGHIIHIYIYGSLGFCNQHQGLESFVGWTTWQEVPWLCHESHKIGP